MWRNLNFLHMWINFTFHHMTDVEKSEISFNMCTIYGILLHFKLFCCKICVFWRFTLFCRKIVFLQFTRFCVEKILAKNSVCGEKMTNVRYVCNSCQLRACQLSSLFIDNHSLKSFFQVFPLSGHQDDGRRGEIPNI